MAVTEVGWLKNNNVNISLGHPQKKLKMPQAISTSLRSASRDFITFIRKMKEKKIISGQQEKYCSNLTPDIIAA